MVEIEKVPTQKELEKIVDAAVEQLKKFVKTGEEGSKKKFLEIWNANKNNAKFLNAVREKLSDDKKILQLYNAYKKKVENHTAEGFVNALSEVYAVLKKRKGNLEEMKKKYGQSFVDTARVTLQTIPEKVPPEIRERKTLLENAQKNLKIVENRLKTVEHRLETDQTVMAVKEAMKPYIDEWRKNLDDIRGEKKLIELSNEELKKISDLAKDLFGKIITDSDINDAIKIPVNFYHFIQTGRKDSFASLENAYNACKVKPQEKQVLIEKIVAAKLQEMDRVYADNVAIILGKEELAKMPEAEYKKALEKYTVNLYDFVSNTMKKAETVSVMDAIYNFAKNASMVLPQLESALSMESADNLVKLNVALNTYKQHFGEDYLLLKYVINIPLLKEEFKIENLDDLLRWLETNKETINDAKRMVTNAMDEWIAYRESKELWGGLGLTAEEERARAEVLKNKLSVTDAVLLSDVFSKLGKAGYGSQETRAMVLDGIAMIYDRDTYLISPYLTNIIRPLIDVVGNEKDLQKAIVAVNTLIGTRYPTGQQNLPYARIYFLDRFEAVRDRLPRLISLWGHQELFGEIWDKPASYEYHPYYRVRPPFLFGKEPWRIPTFYSPPYSLSLRAPGTPFIPADPRGVVFGLDFFPGAENEFNWVYGQLYPPTEIMFRMNIPAYYRIGRVSAERLIKELTGIFAVMPTVPYSSHFIGGRGEAGAYYGEESWEVGARGAGRTSTGRVTGEIRGGKSQETGRVSGIVTGGGVEAPGPSIMGGGVHSSTTIYRWEEGQFSEGMLSVYKQAAKDSNKDMIVFLYGLDRPMKERERSKEDLLDAIKSVRDVVPKEEPKDLGAIKAMINDLINDLSAKAGDVGWDPTNKHERIKKHIEEIQNELEQPTPDWEKIRNHLDKINNDAKALNPDMQRLKGRLYIVTKEGDYYQVAYGKDTETEFLNYLFGEIDTKEIYASVKTLGREQFTEHAPAGGFNGAAVGVTFDRYAIAGLGEIVSKLRKAETAYIEQAGGFSVSRIFSEGDVIASIYRGSEVPKAVVDKEGAVEYQQQHSVEMIYRKLGREPLDVAYQIRLLGGYPGMGGVKLMTENIVFPGGLGGSFGYGEVDLTRYYNLIDADATNLYEKTKNTLVNVYGWQKDEAKQVGWLLSGTYMLSSLQGYQQTLDAQGKLEGENKKEVLKNYFMCLGMLWLNKHNLLVGVEKMPGFGDAMDAIERAQTAIIRNPEYQETIMNSAINEIESKMRYDVWKMALGYGYDSNGNFKVYTLGSAEVRDKDYAWGNLRGIIFFDEELYSDTIATLYRYGTEASFYLDAFTGLGFPYLRWRIGVAEIETNKLYVSEMTPQEMLELLTSKKREFVGSVVYGGPGTIDANMANKWDILLSSELKEDQEKKRAHSTYYTRIKNWPEEGVNGVVELGNKENAKEWEKEGFSVQRITFEEKDGKLMLRLPEAGSPTILFNRTKFMLGPTFGLMEATEEGKHWDLTYAGFSVALLQHILHTQKHDILAGIVFGKKEFTDKRASSDSREKEFTKVELEEWQFVLTGRVLLSRTNIEAKTLTYYFIVDRTKKDVKIGTEEDITEWDISTGMDWGTIDITGEGEKFKIAFMLGQKGVKKESGNGIEKEWLAAGGIGWEKITPSSTVEVRIMGGKGPYYYQYGPNTIWDFGRYPYSYDLDSWRNEPKWFILLLNIRW